MNFEYDRLKYDERGQKAIGDAIIIDESGELFRIMTRTQKNGWASYSPTSLELLLRIYKSTGSIESVEKAAKLDYKGEQLFHAAELLIIARGYEEKLPQECIDFYTALNAWGSPIYYSLQMESILYGFKASLTKEQVMIYARLDENEKPIYDPDRMDQIRYGLYDGLSEDEINVYAQLNEKKVPKFEAFEMKEMRLFINKADDKQVQQLKDSINEGLSVNQFNIFCKPEIPAEKMRIYRSFYSLGCSKSLIKHIIKHENLDYDDLKKLKYIITCAGKLKELNEQDNRHIPSFSCKGLINTETDLSDIDIMYEKLANIILNSYYYTIKITDIDSESIEAIEKCLKNNMNPEQIHFLVSSGYSINEIKCISNILLEGMDFNMIKKMREEASDVLSAETIEALFKTEIEKKDIEL